MFMQNKKGKSEKFDIVQGIKTFGNTAGKNISDAIDSSKIYFADKKNDRNQKLLEKQYIAIQNISDLTWIEFINGLPESIVPLSNSNISKAKKTFPIPFEQELLWIDAEFDLRPSGIVVTNEGVFIKTNTDIIPLKKKQDEDEEVEIKPSVLYYFKWDSFEPTLFISENPSENIILSVDPKCQKAFMNACKEFSIEVPHAQELGYIQYYSNEEIENIISSSITMAAGIQSAEKTIFVENNSINNTPAGHGVMAEEFNSMIDNLQGHKSKVLGRDNAKNGPDRVLDSGVDKIFIQTKYHKTARSTLESSFDNYTGQYRYMQNGKPMQLEVPKDQYERVLKGFEEKIKKGKVPGVSDPAKAKEFVRKGRLTYQQALNLAKAGTIESLAYDAGTGIVSCSFVFGISFLATMFFSYRKSNDMPSAIQDGLAVGVQTFGLSFAQHILVNQVGRTNLAATLLRPSQQIVERLGTKASANLVNGIRALSGKTPIYGAAASKHLAKIFRSSVFTAAISFAVFSIPDSHKMLTNKISGSQYAKNMGVLLSSFLGAAGGAVTAGIATAKVAALLGTSVLPGVGTAVGLVGGLVGGIAVSSTANWASDTIWESDFVKVQRLFNAIITCMLSEHAFDENETQELVNELGKLDEKTLKDLFMDFRNSKEQENHFRDFLNSCFENISLKRERFLLPSMEEFYDAVLIENGV